jgi:hypothetical protein
MNECDQLAVALAAAQAAMGNAVFNRINPHFRSKYADLAAIRDATIPALTKNGLAIVQYTTVTPEGDKVLLHTRLMHKSGQSVESSYPIALGTPQAMGSALTYAKRYCWSAMCGIAADDDDDANAAEGATVRKNGVSDIALGQETLTKAKSRPVYDALIKEMRAITEKEGLTKWGMNNSERIHSMHSDFQRWFREEYQNHRTAIEEGVTEDGSVLKQQLKASLEAEGAA